MNSHSKSWAYLAVATIAITLGAQSASADCGTCGPRAHSGEKKTPACCVAAKKAGTECKVCEAKKAEKPACCIAAEKADIACKTCADKTAAKPACCVAAEKAGKECQHCKAKGE